MNLYILPFLLFVCCSCTTGGRLIQTNLTLEAIPAPNSVIARKNEMYELFSHEGYDFRSKFIDMEYLNGLKERNGCVIWNAYRSFGADEESAHEILVKPTSNIESVLRRYGYPIKVGHSQPPICLINRDSIRQYPAWPYIEAHRKFLQHTVTPGDIIIIGTFY